MGIVWGGGEDWEEGGWVGGGMWGWGGDDGGVSGVTHVGPWAHFLERPGAKRGKNDGLRGRVWIRFRPFLRPRHPFDTQIHKKNRKSEPKNPQSSKSEPKIKQLPMVPLVTV